LTPLIFPAAVWPGDEKSALKMPRRFVTVHAQDAPNIWDKQKRQRDSLKREGLCATHQ